MADKTSSKCLPLLTPTNHYAAPQGPSPGAAEALEGAGLLSSDTPLTPARTRRSNRGARPQNPRPRHSAVLASGDSVTSPRGPADMRVPRDFMETRTPHAAWLALGSREAGGPREVLGRRVKRGNCMD